MILPVNLRAKTRGAFCWVLAFLSLPAIVFWVVLNDIYERVGADAA